MTREQNGKENAKSLKLKRKRTLLKVDDRVIQFQAWQDSAATMRPKPTIEYPLKNLNLTLGSFT